MRRRRSAPAPEQFYQLEIQGKFRQAEAFVAEDTKDYFYNGGKPDIKALTIDSIDLTDNGNKATLHFSAKVMMKAPGMLAREINTRSTSTWKFENGDWFMYKNQDAAIDTPFGKLQVRNTGSGDSPLPSSLPNPVDISTMLTIDHPSLVLTSGSQTPQTATITNHLPGPISLAFGEGYPAGLIVGIDKSQLASGEKAVVSFRAESNHRPVGEVHITAVPLPDLVVKITTR
jgi:hypothetical protein